MKKVKLKVSHTHAGVFYLPGTILELRDKQAAWLCDIGVAELYSGNSPAANTAKPEPKPSEAKP